MDRKVLQLLAVLVTVFVVGSLSYDLADIPFPCDHEQESELMLKALEFVCVADKRDPTFDKFLRLNGFRREKRDSKLLNALISLDNQEQMEKSHNEEELPETSDNVFHESVINEVMQSNLKPVATGSGGRRKREDGLSGGPDLLEKIYDCCEYSHRVRTSCTLQDLKPYCSDYIKNGQGS